MKITGKAKEDFENWFYSEKDMFGGEGLVSLHPKAEKYLIVEFFGNKKYLGENLFMFVFEKSFAIKASFMTFDDIIDQAIELCNKVYNNVYNNEWLKQ